MSISPLIEIDLDNPIQEEPVVTIGTDTPDTPARHFVI